MCIATFRPETTRLRTVWTLWGKSQRSCWSSATAGFTIETTMLTSLDTCFGTGLMFTWHSLLQLVSKAPHNLYSARPVALNWLSQVQGLIYSDKCLISVLRTLCQNLLSVFFVAFDDFTLLWPSHSLHISHKAYTLESVLWKKTVQQGMW